MHDRIILGDVNGNFDLSFSKIATINKKHGPFSAIFCVGNFFGPSKDISALQSYIDGEKKSFVFLIILAQ